jgi:fused signal recognition particle receptor
MNELKKINNIVLKFCPQGINESLLTIDATTGQTGISQAKNFSEVTKITSIILTKLDGTSKGGIVLAIKDAFNIPVKMVGLGEKLEDLKPFEIENFIEALLGKLYE